MQELVYAVGGCRLFAAHAGTGPVIVMIHGPGATHQSLVPILAPLADRFHVVLPDARGSGKSPCPDRLDWDRLADDAAALLDHLGAQRAILGGISGGSGVAVRFALRHPKRLAGMVLIQPFYAGTARGLTNAQAAMMAPVSSMVAAAETQGMEAFRPLYARSPAMEAYFDALLKDTDAAGFLETYRFMASAVQPFETDAQLRQITVPTLVIPGDDAIHPPEISRLYVETIPGCTSAPLTEPPGSQQRLAAATEALRRFCGFVFP